MLHFSAGHQKICGSQNLAHKYAALGVAISKNNSFFNEYALDINKLLRKNFHFAS